MAYEVTLVIYTEYCPILISNIFFSQIQIRHFFQPKSIDFLSLNKTYSVGTYEKRLDEALLMSINNICFRWKIRKIISGYFSYLRLCLFSFQMVGVLTRGLVSSVTVNQGSVAPTVKWTMMIAFTIHALTGVPAWMEWTSSCAAVCRGLSESCVRIT